MADASSNRVLNTIPCPVCGDSMMVEGEGNGHPCENCADATPNRMAVDVIAQMIRAYDGKGVAAGVFAEAIEDALAKAGYRIV